MGIQWNTTEIRQLGLTKPQNEENGKYNGVKQTTIIESVGNIHWKLVVEVEREVGL
jgi:hypothetical protein